MLPLKMLLKPFLGKKRGSTLGAKMLRLWMASTRHDFDWDFMNINNPTGKNFGKLGDYGYK